MMFNAARFFERHIERSVGCTEPAAIALSSSIAFNAIFGKLPRWLFRTPNCGGVSETNHEDMRLAAADGVVEEVSVHIDRGTFKNATNAVIPHTRGRSGVNIAAALGLFCDPESGLMLFKSLNDERIGAAMSVLNRIHVSVHDSDHIFIRTSVRLSDGAVGECITKYLHTNIVSVTVNGNLVFAAPGDASGDDDLNMLAEMRVDDFIHIVEQLPEDAKRKLRDALKTNMNAYKIARDAACAHGAGIEREIIRGWVGEAARMVHTAVECRMSGATMEVMTCAGSGNMGLTASLPLVALHHAGVLVERIDEIDEIDERLEEKTGEREEILLRAFALTHLIANFVSIRSGYISAACGCAIKAGIGVAAGIAYYLASSQSLADVTVSDAAAVAHAVKTAINNMASDVTGMICEGASRKCALKASTAVISAARSALLALRGVEFGGLGDHAADATVTLNHIAEIARSMADTDKEITRILQKHG